MSLLDWLIPGRTTDSADDPMELERMVAAEEVLSRLTGTDQDTFGTIEHYGIKDFSSGPSATDTKFIVQVDADKYGGVDLVLDMPGDVPGVSEYEAFMDYLGVPRDNPDGLVGKDVEVGVVNGNVEVLWEADQGRVIESQDPKAEDPIPADDD